MDAPSQHENFNHRNTVSISRINPPKFGGGLKFSSDADISEKGSFRSGTIFECCTATLLSLSLHPTDGRPFCLKELFPISPLFCQYLRFHPAPKYSPPPGTRKSRTTSVFYGRIYKFFPNIIKYLGSHFSPEVRFPVH